MKKIAIVTPVFPPQRGGIGKVAETDAMQLAALGYDVTVFAPGASAEEKRVPVTASTGATSAGAPGKAYALRRLPSWFRYGHAAFAPNAGALLNRYDAVLLHFPFFGAAEPLMLSRLFASPRKRATQAKIILSYHMDVTGRGIVVPLFSLPTRLMTSRFACAADRVLVTSTDYAAASRLAPDFAAQPERFRALAPGVDVHRFSPGPKNAELLARWGIPADAPVIVFTGGLDEAHYFKGIPVLLRAFAAEALDAARLLIIGEGGMKKLYQEMAAILGVADRVIFAGAVPDAALPETLRLGDVFAFPSTDSSEAFGIAALEAMSCGLPVVASDLPGVRTIVRPAQTGMLVPPGSASALAVALATLCGDARKRRSLGETARAMAENEYAYERRTEQLALIMKETGL
ncbi:MAG: hypothetical protein RLZZ324_792 [Candidatus Parcubacteria bacterium]|jgi:glycosyltransferase involved in cell wall biosynthesis